MTGAAISRGRAFDHGAHAEQVLRPLIGAELTIRRHGVTARGDLHGLDPSVPMGLLERVLGVAFGHW
jgi:hypothetical protein